MMNPASLPHEKLMQATELIDTHIAPALREIGQQQGRYCKRVVNDYALRQDYLVRQLLKFFGEIQ